MTISMKIEDNLDELGVFLNKKTSNALLKSTKRSIRRSFTTLQKEANQAVRREVNLKASEIRREWFKEEKKLKGSNLAALSATLFVRNKPVSLIRLVAGSKLPRTQRGISILKRRKLRVSVKKGRRTTLGKAFIAKGRNANFQVFRRRTSKSTPLVKQSAPSPHLLFLKPAFRAPIEAAVGKRLVLEFLNNMKFFLGR